MGVYIKHMEMPTSCLFCWLNSMKQCRATGGDITWATATRNRRGDCPLIPVPEPHGRLGDLDELYNHLNEWYLTHEHGFSETEKIYISAMLSGVKDSPTIIPASEKEE